MADYQWYPGHMTKARRMMQENMKLVDLVIELVDARIPLSSRNPDIDTLCAGKSRILLMGKADLADPVRTQQFLEWYKEQGVRAIAMDLRTRKGNEEVRRYVMDACRARLERNRKRGIVGRPLRAMVAGIPNCGKSTFINSFAGRAGAKTGNKPGVTRGKQWIRMNKDIELLDTPGILWPKFDDQTVGIRLALTGAIRDEILEQEELAVWFLGYMQEAYPGMIRERYEDQTSAERREWDDALSGRYLLLQIAEHRNFLSKGGKADEARAARQILDDFRAGRIGRITLESPPIKA